VTRNLLKLGGELISLLVAASSWGLGLYGQKIAGHEVEWNWIAAVSGAVFVALVFLHIYGLNSELWALKDTRADVSIFFAKEPPMYSSVEHWYRILVKNHSTTASAQGVDVRLINIDPLPPDISPVFFPTSLGVKDRERIDIAPNDKWTFDVVQDCGTTLRVLTKISRRGSTYQGITSSIVVGLRYRMTLAVISDNPRRRDCNGEERTFILCQPTGNPGDLEFYEEKANPEPTIEPPVVDSAVGRQ